MAITLTNIPYNQNPDKKRAVLIDNAQTISGEKTFTAPGAPLILKHPNANLLTPPDAGSNVVLDFRDVAGTRVGALYNTILSDGSVQTSIQAIRNGVFNTLGMYISSAGRSNLSVNGSVVRYVKYHYDNGAGSWCRLWSDGWLEQGGIITATGQHAVYFLRPFNSSSYAFSGIGMYDVDHVGDNWFDSFSAQGFICAHNVTGRSMRWYACGVDSVPV